MRFCQNVISNFPTRSRRKSKIWTYGVLTENCHIHIYICIYIHIHIYIYIYIYELLLYVLEWTALSKRQAIAQQKKIEKSSTDSILDSDKQNFSPFPDIVNTPSTITKSLARLHEFTASSDSFNHSSLKHSLPTSKIGGDMPLGSENSRYHSRFNENVAFRNCNDTPLAPVMTQHDQPTATHSPPNTDLRMDWADACSLG